MGNIISYVKRKWFSNFLTLWTLMRLTALFLSQLSYLCFDSFIESVPKFDITFKNLAEKRK